MKLPVWLLRLLPMWDYICPKCRKEVEKNSSKCPICGEQYGCPIRVPPKVLKDKKALEDYIHKNVFPRISASQRDYLAQYFTEIFSDGFESGNFDEWTGTSGSPSVVGEPVYAGSYAAEFDAVEYCYRTLSPAESIIYHRFYVRTNTVPVSGEEIAFSRGLAGGTVIFELGLKYVTDNPKWKFNYRNGASWTSEYSSTVATVDTWYCIELYWKNDASTGELILYLNGSNIASVSNKDTADYGDCDTIRIGVPYESFAGAFTVHCDSVVVADTYIGTEGLSQTVTETITVGDSLSKKFTKSLSDSFSIGESSPKNFTKVTTDAFSISDFLVKKLSKKLTETITFVSSASGELSTALSQTVTETIAIADSLAKGFVKKVSESISFYDETRGKFTKTLSDVLSVADSLSKGFTKKVSDAVTIADSQVKKFTKKLTDSVTVTDSISTVLTEAYLGAVVTLKFLKRKISKVFG